MASSSSKPVDWKATKTITVSRGHLYHYVHLPVPQSSKPTLLLLHGFPESPSVFDPIASWLNHELGYPLLVPYLLGYMPSARPSSPSEYALLLMAKDMLEIVSHEGISSILSIGRDWGAGLSQRVALASQTSVTKGCVTMCVQYFAPKDLPRDRSDLQRFITQKRTEYGVDYDNYHYFRYFCEDATAPSWDADLRRVWQMLPHFSDIAFEGDKFKEFIDQGAQEAGPPGDAEKLFLGYFGANGFVGPLNWYKAFGRGHARRAEEQEPWFEGGKLTIPVLYIGGGLDKPCPPTGMDKPREYLDKLTTVALPNAGHNLGATDPEGLKKALGSWLADNGF